MKAEQAVGFFAVFHLFPSPSHSQQVCTCSPGASVTVCQEHVSKHAFGVLGRVSSLSTQAHCWHVVLHEPPVVRHVLPGVRQRLRGHPSCCMLRQSKMAVYEHFVDRQSLPALCDNLWLPRTTLSA